MSTIIKLKYGTRSQFTTLVSTNALVDRQPYLITEVDTSRTLCIGTGVNTYITIADITDISAHAALTTTHGVTGLIVGTTDTINGFTGGVTGQEITIVKSDTANNLTITHNSASGTQKIYNSSNATVTYTNNKYGRVTLIFNGTVWVSER